MRRPSPRVTFSLLALLAGAGCDAIAGIQEGELASGQDGSVTGDSGPGLDGTIGEGGADGPSGDSTASDAGDAGVDTGNAGEAGLVPLRCAVDTSTTVLVDDLSTYDGGAGLDYIQGVWIGLTSTSQQLWVITQISGYDSFLTYEVDLMHGTSTPTGQLGIGTSARLLDAITTGSGNGLRSDILATYPGSIGVGGPQSGLQVVELPNYFGPSSSSSIEGPGHVAYESGRLASVPTTGAWPWLAVTRSTLLVTQPDLTAGAGIYIDGGPGSHGLAIGSGIEQLVAQQPFFDNAGELYAFANGVDPDGGTSVFAIPDDLEDAATMGTIPGATTTVLCAQPSAADPTRALVVADAITGQSVQVYAGLAPFAQLTSLTLGAAPLSAGAAIPLEDFPSANLGRSTSGDELAIIGTPADGSSGLVFLWLSPSGEPVSQLGQKIEDDGNQAQIAAVAFQKLLSEALGATLYIAWIETAAPDGSATKFGRIYAAQVTCAPPADGG